MHDPKARLMTFNLETDGGEEEGGKPPQRWRDAHELLARRAPDVLFRQEATFSHLNGNRRLHQAEQALGMRGFLSPTGQGRNPTALFVRPSTFAVQQQYPQLQVWRTPPTNVVVRLRDVPDVDVVAVSWHGAFNSPALRELEAGELSALADKMKQSKGFMGGGDCNEYPVADGEKLSPVDWTSLAASADFDRVHMEHRTTVAADGTRVSCTAVDRKLLGCGLHDAARYAAHTQGQTSALHATAGHASTPGQGGARRIDRIYLDPWLVQAVLEVNVIDTTGISDHHAVEVVLSRRLMAQALRRAFPKLPPMHLAA
ncbi:endonuclease/exonuclease/phosphatase family protein [Streptomyces daliensis]